MKARAINGIANKGLVSAFGIVAVLASGCASSPPPASSPSPTPKQTAPSAVQEAAPAPKAAEPEAPVVAPAPKPETAKPVAESAPPPSPAQAEVPKTQTPKAEAKKPEPAPAIAPAAAKAEAPKPAKPAAPNTFVVTSDSKNKTHPFFGQGSDQGFVVNGEQGKNVVVTRGESYTFDVETGVQHDFYLSTVPAGWGAGTYTDGVTGQFTYQGQVSFEPGVTTPDVLYYGCRNHKYMGGAIYVVNKGEKPKIKEVVVEDQSGPAFKVTEQQVKQKMMYGQMLLKSESIKKVDASGNAEAIGLVDQAKGQLSSVDGMLAKGQNAQALAAVDEGIRLLNAASRMTSTVLVEKDYKSEYETLHREVKGYYKSYQKNAKSQSKDKLAVKFDEAKFNTLMKDAESAATRGDHKTAADDMHKASAMVTAALSVMLDSATVVYEQDFATPKDEFEFEVARYESYRELIPLAIEQRNPSPQQVEMMNEFVAKAERIVGEGKPFAERGDYATAIQAMQAATDNIKRALMIAGVR